MMSTAELFCFLCFDLTLLRHKKGIEVALKLNNAPERLVIFTGGRVSARAGEGLEDYWKTDKMLSYRRETAVQGAL